MADIGVTLRAHLLSLTDVSALVGGNRIFPDTLPQNERRTSIVYSRITGFADHVSQGRTPLSRPRVQVACWAETRQAAVELAELVMKKLDGKRWEVDDVKVQGSFMVTETDRFEEAPQLWCALKDYYIHFEDR